MHRGRRRKSYSTPPRPEVQWWLWLGLAFHTLANAAADLAPTSYDADDWLDAAGTSPPPPVIFIALSPSGLRCSFSPSSSPSPQPPPLRVAMEGAREELGHEGGEGEWWHGDELVRLNQVKGAPLTAVGTAPSDPCHVA